MEIRTNHVEMSLNVSTFTQIKCLFVFVPFKPFEVQFGGWKCKQIGSKFHNYRENINTIVLHVLY